MAEDDLYDEFGNFLGENSEGSSSESDRDELVGNLELLHTGDDHHYATSSEDDESEDGDEQDEAADAGVEPGTSLMVRDQEEQQIDSSDVLVKAYGTAVETLVMSEDTPLGADEPVIKPMKHRKMKVEFTDDVKTKNPLLQGHQLSAEMWKRLPELTYDRTYMIDTMNLVPERIRTIAIAGHLHSGKTSLVDGLVLETHLPSIHTSKNLKTFKPLRYTDNHKIEIDRGLSIRMAPITLLLPDLKDTSYVFNMVDTPGHIAFEDESSAALAAVDGMVLVIDVVEGFTFRDRNLVSEALKLDLPICVVLNKIDRLVLDLRLPPRDAYYKLDYIVDDINAFIENSEYSTTYSHGTEISPLNENVIFASASLQLAFSLASFADLYYQNKDMGDEVDPRVFQSYLWGDVFYDTSNNTFTKDSRSGRAPHSFVHFVLEPIYKLFTYTLVSDVKGSELGQYLWHEFGVELHKSNYKLDPPILLRNVFKALFSVPKVFALMVTKSVSYTSNLSKLVSSEDGFVGKVVKLIESSNGQDFLALVRVVQGSIAVGSRVRVVGESYTDNDEDTAMEVVSELYLPGGRYKVPVDSVGSGSLVFVGGVDSIINNGGILLAPESAIEKHSPLFKFPDYANKSVFKVAIEPANPSELPRFLDGLRKINKTYLASKVKVEQSGEHVLMGPGELYLDCVLHDLRLFFTDNLEIKVSDPTVRFSETCSETSVVKIPASIGSTNNNSSNNKISVIAEPNKDWKLAKAIELGKIDLSQPIRTTAKVLRHLFGWDALAARSVWSFGPNDLISPTMLLDDTLEEDTDKEMLYSVRESICAGFKWAVNEGPLCDEPIRNTKFKILDMATLSTSIQTSSAQMVPLMRKACYVGLLTAKPRLMEPVYTIHVTTSEPAIDAVTQLVSRRRGQILHQNAIPGTMLFVLQGYIPVIESVGLETDIRLRTQGQAMSFVEFRRWDVVPGDPLDSDALIPKLKPAPRDALARDFVMKTRRRKGLSGDPSLQKYVDPTVYQKLRERGMLV